MARTLLVLGAGVVGMSCAWRAARAGWAVTVLDPAPGSGASWVAGGMLAPVTEAWPGEEALLELGDAALRRWPRFATELRAAGADPGLRTDGTLLVAAGAGDRAELDALAGHLARLGRQVRRLTGRELRRCEPSIGSQVRAGLVVPTDHAVDNRLLLAALWHAATAAGVRLDRRAADTVLDDGERVVGVRVLPHGSVPAGLRTGPAGGVPRSWPGEIGGRAASGLSAAPAEAPPADAGTGEPQLLVADAVLVSAGAHAAALHPTLHGLVHPVKGEILRLRHRPGALPPPRRTVRALVDGRPVYLVPREGGLVVGATQHEAGFDPEPTVAGVRDLLRDAERVLPGLAEYGLTEASAGLRPGSPDNLPLIGEPGPHGLVVATGHGRNGILLAPLTADAVVGLLGGVPLPEQLRAADPRRFGEEVAGVRVAQR